MVEAYTAPELATERDQAKRCRVKVTQAGGCPFCTHRLTNWGGCQSANRSFPLCLKTPGTSFDPDHDKLRGNL